MAKELISYVEAGATAELQKGIKNIKQLNTELLKSVENANKISEAFRNIRVPSQARGVITQLNAAVLANNQLMQQQIALNAALANSITATNAATTRNTQARAVNNQRTQEEITNTRLLTANASRAAQANSTFASSYERLSAQQNIASRRVQDLIARGRTAEQTQRQYNRELALAQRQFDTLNVRVLAADRAVGRFNRNVGNYPAQAARGLKDLIAAFGVVGGVTAFAAITKDIFNTTKELQSLDFALKQVIGSNELFGQSQAFLQRISEAYGIEIKGLTRSYTGFYAASKNAIESGAITAEQINQIFESVSKASGAMGLSVDQQQGAFLALQQMISKGNVQAEEIRGQLAERLPGAFGILAKSMGVTEIQLNKLLKDGKVLAAEVLPAFAAELEKAYGVENLTRVENLTAETTRLGNAWTEFIRALNDGDGTFSRILVGLIADVREALQFYSELLKSEKTKINETSDKVRTRAYELQMQQLKDIEEQTRKNYAAEALDSTNDKLRKLTEQNNAIKENIRLLEESKKKALENDYMFGLSKPVRTLKAGIATENKDLAANQNELAMLQGSRKAWEEILKVQKKVDYVGAGRVKKQKQDIDYLHEIYLLQKQNTENQISDQDKIMSDEEKNYDKRLEAANNYFFQKDALLKLDHDEEVRLNQLNYANQKETYTKAIADGTATYENLRQLKYQYQIKAAKIDSDYEDKKAQLAIENAKRLQGVLLDIQAQKSRNDLNRVKLGNTSEQTSLFDSVTGSTSLKQFAELENKLRDINSAQQDAEIGLLNVDIKRNLQEQARIKMQGGSVANNQKLLELQKQQIALEQNLADIDKERADSVAQLYNEMKQATTDYLQSITQGVFSDSGFSSLGKMFDQVTYTIINASGEIETKVGSTFSKMFDQAQTTTEKIAVAFQTMGDTLQEVFNFLNQNRQAAFDKENADAERMFEIRKKYAGDSTEAQADLERQLEDKKRDIRIREAKAAKEAALFNIAVNTAQAVVAALATVPPNIGLSIAVGAIGLAQGIAVASRPLPAYKDGTNYHKGGAALVGDGGKNEVVWQPSHGYSITPNTNTIMDLQKGSKVYPDIASSGLLNSGLPLMNVPSKGLTEEQMDRIMARHLGSSSSVNINFDERGYSKFQKKANSKTISHNNRISFKGNVIRG